MNKEEIDKWLDNEYGVSYTRLEELHNYFFEKYTDQKEEIQRLENIIKEVREWSKKLKYETLWQTTKEELEEILDKENKEC